MSHEHDGTAAHAGQRFGRVRPLVRAVVVALAVLPLLVPDLSIVRPADVIAVGILLAVGVGALTGHRVEIRVPRVAWLFVVFASLVGVSFVYQATTGGVGVRDLFEIVRPIRLLVIIVAVSVVVRGRDTRAAFLRWFLWATAATATFGLVQLAYLAAFGIDAAVLASLYAPAVHIHGTAVGLRAMGVAANPNAFAIVLVPGLIAAALALLNRGAVGRSTLRAAVVALPLAMVGVFASQSRTGLVALAVGLAVAVLIWYPVTPRLLAGLAGVGVLAAGAVAALAAVGILDPRYLNVLNLAEAGSLQARFDRWERLLAGTQLVSVAGVIGHGPSEAFLTAFGSVDSEYVELYYQYGVLGVVCYLAVFGGLATAAAKRASNRRASARILTAMVAAFVVACLVYGLTAVFYENLHLSTLVAVLVGSVLHSPRYPAVFR